MSTLSSQDGFLHAGINHHLRYLQQDSNLSGYNGMVDPRDLYFNENTIATTSGRANRLHARKAQHNNLGVYVTGLRGKTLNLALNDGYTVKDLKDLVQEQENVSPDQQRIFMDGREMDDGRTLREYNPDRDSVLYLVLQLRDEGCSAYRIHKECFDDSFHMDFTQVFDQQLCARGGASYTLPLGSMRYALKVLDKYGDNTWLGIYNRGNERSCPGEWPVAYHGTTDPRAAEIVQSGGFDLSKGTRFLYGHGIYCTPDPEIALSYASPYKYNGRYYKLILQARVDPSRREVIPHMNYWIAKENDAIRPYGICVYPCDF